MRRYWLAVLLVAACAEMREPPAASRVPPGLRVVAADPLPAVANEAAAALADGGRAIQGSPAAVARAIGQMELLLAEFRRDPRWAPIGTVTTTELRTARLEWRSALGIRDGAEPEAVAAALGRTSIALLASDTRSAGAALDPSMFDPGAAVTLARLVAPGPLPQSAIASSLARQEVDRVQRMRLGGPIGALDPNAAFIQSITSGGIPPVPR
jgi:hypothetical protein